MEPIEVTARFNADGKVIPMRLVWQGQSYSLDPGGRQWQAADGLHVLAMTLGGRMFELVFVPAEHRWYLGKVEPGRMAA